jgi:hypothetical protein
MPPTDIQQPTEFPTEYIEYKSDSEGFDHLESIGYTTEGNELFEYPYSPDNDADLSESEDTTDIETEYIESGEDMIDPVSDSDNIENNTETFDFESVENYNESFDNLIDVFEPIAITLSENSEEKEKRQPLDEPDYYDSPPEKESDEQPEKEPEEHRDDEDSIR